MKPPQPNPLFIINVCNVFIKFLIMIFLKAYGYVILLLRHTFEEVTRFCADYEISIPMVTDLKTRINKVRLDCLLDCLIVVRLSIRSSDSGQFVY